MSVKLSEKEWLSVLNAVGNTYRNYYKSDDVDKNATRFERIYDKIKTQLGLDRSIHSEY